MAEVIINGVTYALPLDEQQPVKVPLYNAALMALAGSSASQLVKGGLISFWKLNEASGKRYDSIGANHLADNNTVTGAEGIRGPASQFTSANSEYLSIADNTDLSTGDIDFTFSCWVYLDSKTAVRDTLGKWGAAGQFEYLLLYDNGADRFQFFVSNNGTTTASVTASTFGSPSAATWYFITVYHDSVGNVIGISVNNGTANTTAHTTGVFNSTTGFSLGRRGATSPVYHDGRMKDVRFWKRLLAASEVTYLYNGGLGDPA